MVSKKSYISEQFLDHLDNLSGLTYTLEQRQRRYEKALDNIQGTEASRRDERSIEEVGKLLESVFEEIDALDSLIEYADMKAPVAKGHDKGYIDLEDFLHEAENGRYTEINTWKEAVVFADRFNDGDLEVLEENLSVAGTMIEHYEAIKNTYTKVDHQFDWIIGTETEAREQLPTDDLGLYEVEPPIYSLLNTEHNSRAAKLNSEV